MIVFLVFLGASSPACDRPSTPEREPIRFDDDACPSGRFPALDEHAGCRCSEQQDKAVFGPFDLLAECITRPQIVLDEPRVDIVCSDPPTDCTYEGRVLTGTIGEVSCGTLVCPEPVCSMHCAAPPANCRYLGQLASGPCGKVTCGKLHCEDEPRCDDGERRFEPCWTEGIRGQARHVCENGRWLRAAECELGTPM